MVASPVRTCIGCGEQRPQGALIRLTLVEGSVRADLARRAPGRGGYICGPGCVESAAKRKGFGRAFRGRANVDLDALRRDLQELVARRQLTLTPAEGKH